jgi:hypothetical protein
MNNATQIEMETGVIYQRQGLGDYIYQIAKKADGALFSRLVSMGGYGKPKAWQQLHKMPDLGLFTKTDKVCKRFPKTLNLL